VFFGVQMLLDERNLWEVEVAEILKEIIFRSIQFENTICFLKQNVTLAQRESGMQIGARRQAQLR